MVRLGEKGISDIMVVALMFILLVIASVLVHQYQARALKSAANRQSNWKSTQLYKSLEKSEVNPYGTPALYAAAEHLVIPAEPTVPENHLREWLENTTDFLLPKRIGVELTLSHEENEWIFIHSPEDIGPEVEVENFIQEGAIAITKTGGEIENVKIKVNMFKAS